MLEPGRKTLPQLRNHIDRRVPERLVDSVRELGPLGNGRQVRAVADLDRLTGRERFAVGAPDRGVPNGVLHLEAVLEDLGVEERSRGRGRFFCEKPSSHERNAAAKQGDATVWVRIPNFFATTSSRKRIEQEHTDSSKYLVYTRTTTHAYTRTWPKILR